MIKYIDDKRTQLCENKKPITKRPKVNSNIINCKFCELLEELFDYTSQSNRAFYIMTEIFILYHSGDICNKHKNNIIR